MASFNPYHKWLGIPLDEQPASYYRLLGIAEYESDLDVIESAAERQMNYLRTFQTGPNFELAERLLNEVSEARVWLLDEQAKAKYDRQLREGNRPTLPPVPTDTGGSLDQGSGRPPPLPGKETGSAATGGPSLPFSPESQPFAVWKPTAAAPETRRRGTKPIWQQWHIMLTIVFVVAIVLFVLLTQGPDGDEPKPADRPNGNNPYSAWNLDKYQLATGEVEP
ncbi:MAG: hypothetical protein VB877_03835 [Pirellulaceae bacterium]